MEITAVGLDLAKNVFQVHALASRRSGRPAVSKTGSKLAAILAHLTST